MKTFLLGYCFTLQHNPFFFDGLKVKAPHFSSWYFMQHYNVLTFYFSFIIVIRHSVLHIVYYMVLLLSTSICCVSIAAVFI